MLLKPKNWASFQHYATRNPPWIKFHRSILNDRQFMLLPTSSKALAPMLWLLASEHKNGVFDASIDELCFRLRMDAKEIKSGLSALIDKGFFLTDSNVLADCKQLAPESCSETETETETDKEPKRATRYDAVRHLVSLGVDEKVAIDWIGVRKAKKLTPNKTAIDKVIAEAETAGIVLADVIRICCERGWGGFRRKWLDSEESVPATSLWDKK